MAASVAVAEDKAYHKELEARRFRSKGAKGIGERVCARCGLGRDTSMTVHRATRCAPQESWQSCLGQVSEQSRVSVFADLLGLDRGDPRIKRSTH